MHQANEDLKDNSVIECPRIISQETLSHAEMMMHTNGWFNENIEPVAIETPKIEWFENVPAEVRCKNCKHWDAPDSFEKGLGHTEGQCNMLPAYGGAWHNAGTEPDMFCSEFEIKDNV